MSTRFSSSPGPSTTIASHGGASDIVPRLTRLQALIGSLDRDCALSAPPQIHAAIDLITEYLEARPPTPLSFSSSQALSFDLEAPYPTTLSNTVANAPALTSGDLLGFPVKKRPPYTLQIAQGIGPHSHNVRINRITVLEALYHYERPNLVKEYLETSISGSIGHKFAMELQEDNTWVLPDFAYSLGEPSTSPTGRTQKVHVLVDSKGKEVECHVSHKTCQGIKVCPFYNSEKSSRSHTTASRELLQEQLLSERRVPGTSPKGIYLLAALRQRTLAYFQSLKTNGCLAPKYEPTLRDGTERAEFDRLMAESEDAARGHPLKGTCEGRLLLIETPKGPFIRCEHFDETRNRDHWVDYSPSDGRFDIEYLRALWNADTGAIEDIEQEMDLYASCGPQADCTFSTSVSSNRVHCPFPHRNDEGELIKAVLVRVECASTLRRFEPVPEARKQCPWVLVVCKGAHTHPIPPLTKTPAPVVAEINRLLHLMTTDLADMTPRRFIRHPIAQAFLREAFPDKDTPLLSDLHPSLANRDHLRGYIKAAKKEMYPAGTGWDGLTVLKMRQDKDPNEETYIRRLFIPSTEPPSAGICICMTPESSLRLLHASSMQCDISFKRISDVMEFEIGELSEESNTAHVLCRVFTTQDDAEVHRRIFNEVAAIIKSDTGKDWKWRHIHARTVNDFSGMCLVTIDQDRAQAKGLGMFLQDVARSLPHPKPDLHEGERFVQDLGEYEHLRRTVRLCTNHILRNIQKAAVPTSVKRKMASLICMEHPDWDGAIADIIREGGTAAQNWVQDKLTSKFAFPAMCWSLSFVPKLIWQMGDRTTNLIESLHADAYHEGMACTLVGGLLKGKHFDMLKQKTLDAYKNYGVRNAYSHNTEVERQTRSLKRKNNARHDALERGDEEVLKAFKRAKTAESSVARSVKRLNDLEGIPSDPSAIHKANLSLETAQTKYQHALKHVEDKQGSGSGKLFVTLS